MNPESADFTDLRMHLRSLQDTGKIIAFAMPDPGESRPTLRVHTLGESRPEGLGDYLRTKHSHVEVDYKSQRKFYNFLARELRPGSGIVRVVEGTPRGPAATLTCFLASRNGKDVYFATAGHALTNFWKDRHPDRHGSVYLNERGFPSRESSRFLGKVVRWSDRPKMVTAKRYEDPADYLQPQTTTDIALVRLEDGFEWKQRTTCYGSFGDPVDVDVASSDSASRSSNMEKPGDPVPPTYPITRCQTVMKCGAEEPHQTETFVLETDYCVTVFGPKGTQYKFENQVLLGTEPRKEERICPGLADCLADREKMEARPRFAVPGDSGTLVVDKATKMPLGMLIAGSVLDGYYVMTPIKALQDFWRDKAKGPGLVFLKN